MATEVISTIRSSGGDYTSLSAWEAAEQRDLVSADEIAIAECYDDWASGLSDTCTVSGWTTDTTRRIIIRAATGNGHGGVKGAGFWMSYSGTCINLTSQDYVTIQEIEVYGGSGASAPLVLNGGLGLLIDSVISTASSSSVRYAIHQTNFSSTALDTIIIRNSLGIGGGSTVYEVVKLARGNTLQNVTIDVKAGLKGLTIFGNTKATNVAVYGATSADFSGTYDASSSNNASSDATAPGTSAVTSLASTAFNNYASEDYTPSSGGALEDAGADLSGSFTIDIAGATRGATWDIGAYELIGGATTYDVSASFGLSQGMTQAGTAQALGGITLANSVSCDDSGLGQAQGSSTFNNQMSVSNSGVAQALATATLANQLGYSVDGIIAFFVDVSFATSHSGTFSGTATGQGAISLDASLDQTVSSIAQTIASVIFNTSHGLQNTTGQTIDGAISLGVSAGFQTLGAFTISGNITLNASLATQLNASAQANANLNLGAQIGLSVLAQAAAQAGITLSQVVSVVHTGTSTVFGITTPDGRIYTVEIDTRTLTIEAEDRTYTVN